MFCNNCGSQMVDGKPFCPGCGQKLQRESAFCTNCGGELEASDVFCGHCGVKVDRDSEVKSSLMLVEGDSAKDIKSFYMGKFPVTQREWTAIMGNNPSIILGPDLPVNYISWYDAVDYCNKRSAAEGLEVCYRVSGREVICHWNASGYRLPTILEWEYAARGGRNYEKYRFSGSDVLDEVAWHNGNSGDTLHPVGGKKPNILGLYDMTGNVCEWCWDSGSSDGELRYYKGGIFIQIAEIRATLSTNSRFGSKWLGFRVIRLCQ